MANTKLTHNQILVAQLPSEDQQFWLNLLNDLDKAEENYQRKLRYHGVASLDSVLTGGGRETTLQELVTSDSYSGEDYVIKQTEKLLYEEAKRELNMEHRLIFEAVFEQGMKFNSACKLIGKSDKTAKTYYISACKHILHKIRS